MHWHDVKTPYSLMHLAGGERQKAGETECSLDHLHALVLYAALLLFYARDVL